jgi:hypothetical protein
MPKIRQEKIRSSFASASSASSTAATNDYTIPGIG